MADRQNIQNAIQQFANYLAAGRLNNNNNNNHNQNDANINGEGEADELRNRNLHENHNVEDEDDEEEAEAADDWSINNHRNGGIIEGGVAGRPSKKDPLLGEENDADAKKKSSECDLVRSIIFLFFSNYSTIFLFPFIEIDVSLIPFVFSFPWKRFSFY
jgi:hypothetical protein